ncbi:hypothetical protein LTR37_001095 [Vermiconidia calcicola]|uniref:Uncharacterized protein n=1 Tax=Vermiconidia calcicola TaxID=1690605 RepID=A0ACC3NX57_9PEZI|nr:hypothetical protein LTR37_001095 [Vermiconidia calcicola]
MTKKQFALDYSKCALGELQHFMKARGLNVKGRIPKDDQQCIRALETSDCRATFRFQDLPGELRNRIYGEVLILPQPLPRPSGYPYRKSNFNCHPRILVTCSSIRNEADSILYGANVFDISIRMHLGTYARIRGLQFHAVDLYPFNDARDNEEGSFGMLRTQHQKWPASLLKVQNLKMHIVFHPHVYGGWKHRNSFRLAHTLYSLASYLQRSEALRTLVFVGNTRKGSEVMPASELARLLYPLGRLCSLFDCQHEGFNQYPELRQQLHLHADEHKHFYVTNALRRAAPVCEESEAYKALAEVTSDTATNREHTKLRGRMYQVFDLPFDKVDDERKLIGWAEDAAAFFNRIYEIETRASLKKASGFWLKLARRFKKPHQERLLELKK